MDNNYIISVCVGYYSGEDGRGRSEISYIGPEEPLNKSMYSYYCRKDAVLLPNGKCRLLADFPEFTLDDWDGRKRKAAILAKLTDEERKILGV